MEVEETGSGISFSFPHHSNARSLEENNNDDEIELQWVAIERLPTFRQLRMSLFDNKYLNVDQKEVATKKVIDVTKLGAVERHVIIDKLLQFIVLC